MGALSVAGLGKCFRVYRSALHRLGAWLGLPVRHEDRWVLRDISFSVQPGESVGLVGRNGAGKSTLLKLITGVMAPSCGQVQVSGRVSALLELGMGFHPEFTGRQNVLMQAYLQGMSHEEVAGLMASIAEFAELGDYFDMPVRVYSSGMQVRLAFSVATAVRPDVLIVDEALAVGDAYFQHKCFDRIRRFKEAGTTLLFVSHDPGTVKSLCERAILIEGGRIMRDGVPADVLDLYNAIIVPEVASQAIGDLARAEGGGLRFGDGRLHIREACWRVHGQETVALTAGQPAELHLLVEARESMVDFTIGLLVKDRLGNDIFGTNTFHLAQEPGPLAAGQCQAYVFRFLVLNLGPSHYSLTLALHASSNHLAGNYDWWERAITFQVVPEEGNRSIGVCHMPVQLERTATPERAG